MTPLPSVAAGLAALALVPLICAPSEARAADKAPAAPATAPAKAPVAPAVGKSGLYSTDTAELAGNGRQIRDVIRDVAELYQFNVNIPDDIEGIVNDRLANARWQDFFTMILDKKGYAWRIDGEMVVISKKKADLKNKIRKLDSGNISVDFVRTPVADAVAAICEVMEKNLAPLPPELLGEAPAGAAPGAPAPAPKVVTINWKGVSWQRTLSQILESYNYGYREEEGVISVLPLAQLNNVPSETRVYKVAFADATAVATTINSVFKSVASGTGKDATQMLTASAETTQQLVIVTARPDFLRSQEGRILSLITQMDQPAKQVLIESRIVERTADNGFNLGFKAAYGAGDAGAGNPNNDVNFSNAGQRNVSSSAATLGSIGSTTGTGPTSFILSEKDFKFYMNALETDTKTNVLQNPTLVVKDDGQGAMRVIRRVPYFESSTTQNTGGATATYTVKFINIGTSLYLKPKIKDSDHIQLNINQADGGGPLTGGGTAENQEGTGGLSVSAQFGQGIQNPSTGSAVPVVDNRDIRTSVLLRDGYTVVLGGLSKDSDSRDITQTPILGDIPVIGRLFQSNATSKGKLNLMAFITARIIDPYNSNYRDILGLDRVNELGLTAREIEGGSYRISEAERDSLNELLHKRDAADNAAKSAELNRRLNGDEN